ncbi:MAG TPA: RnfABCDGE type electron transport complex subunit D [Candidatus Saccharimonadales bacterium]|nr:RnfABCDGE type electron transport complex subunit D [Candidatus Saccharimonadales bacterium]
MFGKYLDKLDGLLDKLSMYKLLIYYLIGLLAVAIGYSAFGQIHFSPIEIAGSALFLFVVCWLVNQIFYRTLRVPANGDSTIITALILSLIISPGLAIDNLLFMTAAGGIAIASKYLLTYRNKHIFNPAAFAVVLTAYAAHQSASWWIGNPHMMWCVLIGGLLLMRRIRRTEMVLSFLAVSLAATALYAQFANTDVMTTLHNTIFSSALLFMGFVMLTEPQTSPGTKQNQVLYSILTGALFSPRIHLGTIFSTPELDLLIGNVFAYIVNPRISLQPKLLRKLNVTPDTMDFEFKPDKKFDYKPGQYMEFTLPHEHTDLRGQRRFFTLASSPTEETLRIGVKFYPNGSSYKKTLAAIDGQSLLGATNLGGDFTLPNDKQRNLVFIAGGIGVTPYRSMIKYLLDTNEKRPVTLLYSANTAEDIAYMDVFEQARNILGINVNYTLTRQGAQLPDSRFKAGAITPELIRSTVPDYQNATFYVSGPHGMVVAIEKALRQSGIPLHHIKTDFFSGYA